MHADAHRVYKDTKVNTASTGDLLMMLMDASVRHTYRAVEALDADEKEEANRHLLKAQDILAELISSLNFKIEIAQNLFQLYEFCEHKLREANLKKRAQSAREALDILLELRQTWKEAVRNTGSKQVEVETTAARGGLFEGQGGIEFAG